MTIPKITPYTGGVANPDGSQTQTEFTQNMFDQLSYEAELSTELNNTVDGINDTATQVDADATSAAQSAAAAEAAVSGLNYQGLWPDTGGSANKGDTYQTQVSGTGTGQYFTALQNTTVDPVGDNVNWRTVDAAPVVVPVARSSKVCIYGDSITRQNDGDGNYAARGYFHWANAHLGASLDLSLNAGVSGDTTSQMLARIQDVLDSDSSTVIMMGGMNDLLSTSLTSEQIFANLEVMANSILESGRLLVMCTVTPSDEFTSTSTKEAYKSLNDKIISYTKSSENTILCDMAGAYPATSGSSVGIQAGNGYDTVHPNCLGASKMGYLLANALRPYIQVGKSYSAYGSAGLVERLVNPNLDGTGGGVPVKSNHSGVAPDGWDFFTGANVVFWRSAPQGENSEGIVRGQSYDVEFFCDTLDYNLSNSSHKIEITSSVSAGDTYKGSVEVEFYPDECLNINSTELFLQCRDSSNGVLDQQVGLYKTGGDYGDLVFTGDGILKITTDALTVPAGTATIVLQLRVTAKQARYTIHNASARII